MWEEDKDNLKCYYSLLNAVLGMQEEETVFYGSISALRFWNGHEKKTTFIYKEIVQAQ